MFTEDSKSILSAIILSLLINFNYGFVLENNITNEDFIVDFDIEDEDYEMNSQENGSENILKGVEFNEYNRIAGNENVIEIKTISYDTKRSESYNVNNAEMDSDNTSKVITGLPSLDYPKSEVLSTVGIEHGFNPSKNYNTSTEVSLHDVKRTVKIGNFTPRFRIMDSLKLILKYPNCTAHDSIITNIKALFCLIAECKEHCESYKLMVFRMWNIALIWFLVYLIVALLMWCTRGWCSCCLCCKFFKPRETIREAKKYILLNPPGILVTKRGGIINYEPTEREKDCYERFGHFIKTL